MAAPITGPGAIAAIVYQASLTFLVAHTGAYTRPPCLDDEGLQNDLVTNITASKVIESNHYSRTL